MVYETALIKEVGSSAGKMHIGRSRNDLQHTYNRMYYRDRINGLIEDLNKFRSVLISKAGENVHTVMMVYTHAKRPNRSPSVTTSWRMPRRWEAYPEIRRPLQAEEFRIL